MLIVSTSCVRICLRWNIRICVQLNIQQAQNMPKGGKEWRLCFVGNPGTLVTSGNQKYLMDLDTFRGRLDLHEAPSILCSNRSRTLSLKALQWGLGTFFWHGKKHPLQMFLRSCPQELQKTHIGMHLGTLWEHSFKPMAIWRNSVVGSDLLRDLKTVIIWYLVRQSP